MNNLSKVFVFKILATIIFWCIPLIVFSSTALEMAGFPVQSSYMFVRMLGWAYLALCVGYAFGLKSSLKGVREAGPIWVGIISNGGAFGYLLFYGLSGAWIQWGWFVQFVAWSSIVASVSITFGLLLYGVIGYGEEHA